MKSKLIAIGFIAAFTACQSSSEQSDHQANTTETAPVAGQSAVEDTESQKDVVKVAVGSPDHTTLVKALQAADLVNSLANAGPFTVFAPTNKAFTKLPAGTVEDLLKPENKEKLATILQHHVMTSALAADFFQDGQSMGMVDGTNVTFHIKGKDIYIGEAKIIGSVRASNGFVHIIDGVVVPK
ncbi:fasciclin domain-containing protein [Runella slithyformis]|uniref:Beta-Ig-H3/fasciclin n=1 Tax=Runella slithyformis (strain ATCC 29530 / DSM 19594 / LMG 11500 / NCIMB 11436 / LSU 4) TaxID=761193 RepID=A0A7U4E406_RUNSL|nr:fasciclin domain-containing protein [Runella slithyformis]AEI46574.1 beta-Ig-H3/fasciclin [Runella slithyformis DSM 19594]